MSSPSVWQSKEFLSDTLAKLTILDYGLYLVHDRGDGRQIGIVGYLLETKDGRHILVDTGFPPKYATQPEQANHKDGLDSFGRVLKLNDSNLVPGQLAAAGLQMSDIDLLIMTHSDVDHVGYFDAFPDVPMVISKAERALPNPRYAGGKSPIKWPENVEYQLIEGDTVFQPGLAVLASPGHTPGHISLLIRLPETGLVLLAGDALSRPAELEVGNGGAADPAQALASAQRLVAIAEKTGAMLIYGHDPEQWLTLRKAPAFYQ